MASVISEIWSQEGRRNNAIVVCKRKEILAEQTLKCWSSVQSEKTKLKNFQFSKGIGGGRDMIKEGV